MNDAHEKGASHSSLFSSDRTYCTLDSCPRPEYLDMREFSGKITLMWKGYMNEWSCILHLKNGIVTDTELDFYD